MPEVLQSQFQRYGVAALSVAAALSLTLMLGQLIDRGIFLPFVCAVAVSSWYGGIKPGLLAIFLSIFASDYFLISPLHSFAIDTLPTFIPLTEFICVASIVCFLNEQLQSTKRHVTQTNQVLEREIREREQVQQTLQESEALYRATFDRAAVGIGHFAKDGKCLRLNQQYCDTVGYTQAELLQLGFQDITHPDDLQVSEKFFGQLWTGEIPNYVLEKRYIHKNGSVVWVNLTASMVRDKQGTPRYLVAVIKDVSDRKRAEEELRESQAKFAGILEIASSAIISVDENQTIQLFNHGAEKIFGYEANEVLGQSIDILLPEALRHVHQQHIHNFAHSEGRPRQMAEATRSIVGRCKDGREFPAEASISKLKLRDGILFTVILNDISETYNELRLRKQAEENLRQQLLRERLVGTIQERIRSSLKLEKVLTMAVEEVRQFLQTDRTLIYRFNSDWSGVVVVESVGEGWMSLLGIDIQDECFMETHVPLYRQGRIRAVADVRTSDLKECHISLLSRFQVTANLVLPILQGKKLWGLLIAHHCHGSREWHSSEIESLRQISVQLAIAIRQSTLFEHAKKTNSELFQTLHQLQTAQRELVQSEKMVALGQLVAGVAHEINTPLGAIRSSVENITDFLSENLEQLPAFFQRLSQERQQDFFALLQQSTQQSTLLSSKEKRQIKRTLNRQLESEGIENADTIADTLVDLGVSNNIERFLPLLKDSESKMLLNTAYQLASLQKSAQTITTATDRAAKVVFALKTYARHDSRAKKVRANLIDGIETVFTLYHNQLKQGVEVIRNYEFEFPSIRCYPDELNQVWTNLLHNALQAMDNRGVLKIDVKSQQAQVLISITDSGKGIPVEVMPRIFEPFFTTKPPGEGSGLGLDIVKKIIEKHEGTIKVKSVPGETTFTVSLPLDLNE
jgi:PAS domain S-box-containing protein